MAKTAPKTGYDNLVVRAREDAESLGRLYELYYERIFRFCVHRLFRKEVAEDITSGVFLAVAGAIRSFEGRTERDFGNWVYAIAINQVNAYLRKSSRRRRLLYEAVAVRSARRSEADGAADIDWPTLYAALAGLKTEDQTIVTLRYFENLGFERISEITGIKQVTLRVRVHRILHDLRAKLLAGRSGEDYDVRE